MKTTKIHRQILVIAIVLTLMLILVGCSILPDANLITVGLSNPTASSDPKLSKDTLAIAQSFLPKGAKFTAAPDVEDKKTIFVGDLVGDATDEIAFTYQPKGRPSVVHAMVLQRSKGVWRIVKQIEDLVVDFGMVNLIPGLRYELLVGIAQEYSKDKWLQCYWSNGPQLEKFTDFNYSHLDVWPLKTASYGDYTSHLALWSYPEVLAELDDTANVSLVESAQLYTFYFDLNIKTNKIILCQSNDAFNAFSGNFLAMKLKETQNAPKDLMLQAQLASIYLNLNRFQEAFALTENLIAGKPIHFTNAKADIKQIIYTHHFNSLVGLERYQEAYESLLMLDDYKEGHIVASPEIFQGFDNDPALENFFLYNDVLKLTSPVAETLIALEKKSEAITLLTTSINTANSLRRSQRTQSQNLSKGNLFINPTPMLNETEETTTALLTSWQTTLDQLKK